MDNTQVILLAFALSVLVGAVAPWIAVALQKRGVNVQGPLEKAQTGLAVADKLVDGLSGMSPMLPGISAVDKIIEWSEKAVNASEQLLKSQQLSADQRKANAEDIVKSCLTSAGLTVTPDLEKIIDGAIEAAVLALPKTNVPAESSKPAQAATEGKADESVTPDKTVAQDENTGNAESQEQTVSNGLTAEQIDSMIAALNTLKAQNVTDASTVQQKAAESGSDTPNATGAA